MRFGGGFFCQNGEYGYFYRRFDVSSPQHHCMTHLLRYVLAICCATFVFNTFGQAQPRLGVKAGTNMTDLKTTSVVLSDVDPLLNAHVGVIFQYSPLGSAFKRLDLSQPVAKKKTFWSDFAWGLAVQPELLFTTGGGRLNNASNSYFTAMGLTETTYTLRTYDMELPLNLQAGIRYKRTLYIAQFAPFVGLRLSGSLNGSTTDYKTVDGTFPFNQWAFGYGYGVGLQNNHWQCAINYKLTTTPLGQETPHPFTNVNYNPFHLMNQRSLTVSVGYLF